MRHGVSRPQVPPLVGCPHRSAKSLGHDSNHPPWGVTPLTSGRPSTGHIHEPRRSDQPTGPGF
ncbi:Hypothetical protein A7982_08582 [Minicystis rosea]|nr:Hypothetical protein A7982_08582 [Minicystis rosea]